MDPQRNLRVLPSNAPAIPESTEDSEDVPSPHICQNFNRGLECKSCDNLHACLICRRHEHGAGECRSGILQVTSGNAGTNVSATRQFGSDVGNLRSCGFKADLLPANVSLRSAPVELMYEQQSRHPRRIERLPNYWHVELETDRYRAYRARCRPKGEDCIWSDRVEEAFQIALRVFRRRGRKKEPLYGKQSGGNEFISDYIKKTTGVDRNRKQVSSHIQVLKNFLCNNQAWMSFVVDIEPEKSRKKKCRGTRHDEAVSVENNDSDDAAKYQLFDDVHHAHPNPLLPPAETLGSEMHRGPTIRSVNFRMALYKVEKRGMEVVLHNYTSIQTEMGSAPKSLEEIRDWRVMFPHLATSHDDGKTDAPMFLFESNISLLNAYQGEGSNLGTEFIFNYTQGTGYGDWRALTRFYEHKGQEIELKAFSERSQYPDKPYNDLDWKPDLTTGDVRLVVPLKSKWWAHLFTDIISRSGKASARARKTGNPQIVKREEELIRQYLGDISVMQELWATPRVNGGQPQRMAFILWTFNQTRKGDAATTSWRRVLSPISPFEPTSEMMQPHMTLDTAIEDARAQPSVFTSTEYYNSQALQPSIFTENTEGSPGTAHSPGYRSLPSSATTLFPSSDSNSLYPIPPCQEPGYSVFESFDSQDSTYEVATSSQELYEPQNNLDYSQDAIYQHDATALYEYAPQHTEVPDASHDFARGEIQLDYEAPLIAPRANMIPQPHIIEQLEQFDANEGVDQHHDESSQDQPDIQQDYPEHFHHNIDLNLLATQFNAWEDHLRIHPEIERQINDVDALDNTRQVEGRHIEMEGQGTFDGQGSVIRQGEIREMPEEVQEGQVPLH